MCLSGNLIVGYNAFCKQTLQLVTDRRVLFVHFALVQNAYKFCELIQTRKQCTFDKRLECLKKQCAKEPNTTFSFKFLTE